MYVHTTAASQFFRAHGEECTKYYSLWFLAISSKESEPCEFGERTGFTWIGQFGLQGLGVMST